MRHLLSYGEALKIIGEACRSPFMRVMDLDKQSSHSEKIPLMLTFAFGFFLFCWESLQPQNILNVLLCIIPFYYLHYRLHGEISYVVLLTIFFFVAENSNQFGN